jgi:hypothetical protein
MRNPSHARDVVVGDAPSLLPAPESNFVQGARSVWVYYPLTPRGRTLEQMGKNARRCVRFWMPPTAKGSAFF